MMLRIYLKSGNVLRLSGILEYKIENSGNEITSIQLKQERRFLRWIQRETLLVQTIDMRQIEAITVSR